MLVATVLPLVKPGGTFVRLDECGGLAVGKYSRGRGGGSSRRKAEKPVTALRPATAGFARQPRRTGVFENGVVENRMN